MAKNTQIQVINTEITEDFVIIEGIDIDRIILADDLYAEFADEPVIQYRFDRNSETGAPLKYLLKVVSNMNVCKKAKSFGKKIEALEGSFLVIADSFRVPA